MPKARFYMKRVILVMTIIFLITDIYIPWHDGQPTSSPWFFLVIIVLLWNIASYYDHQRDGTAETLPSWATPDQRPDGYQPAPQATITEPTPLKTTLAPKNTTRYRLRDGVTLGSIIAPLTILAGSFVTSPETSYANLLEDEPDPDDVGWDAGEGYVVGPDETWYDFEHGHFHHTPSESFEAGYDANHDGKIFYDERGYEIDPISNEYEHDFGD